MTISNTMSPDYVTRFKLGVWRELITSAVVEWNPDQTTNLYGSGFDGTETEFLCGEPADDIRDFLDGAADDLMSLAERLGSRAPAPEELGRDWVLSRQRAGAGLWDCGYGPEGDRLHAEAIVYGDILLEVSGLEDNPDSWVVRVL
ncbi:MULTISPECIES: hypothetical protein [Protofrankia]|uniref:Uncharacterized protein n=1 Tax=Protofrankia coriariae TaxID=1562887 RepID=A0ABR5EZL5_9ACTN|nr:MULTISPECIES: hypothetical protein [Protofrankia]KLL09882.1 hypothetical protein FrCorBMG51_21875 [Protofrankia coriariae]ONH34206.1 hypothetical protein BL254_17595 [Protofrankia sp. BMG5.30]